MIETAPSILQSLAHRLTTRQQDGSLRSLRVNDVLVDFSSNDYLGLARSAALQAAIQGAAAQYPTLRNGATGSRLLAGQTELTDEVETELARFYQSERALIFNSGYDANIGLLACLPQKGDTLLTDELIHASMIDGARLSYATRHRFRHNDLADLEAKLQQATGQVFVAVESVYSMDGDYAPLPDLCTLCDRYGAALIVDEAHASGVYGPNGEGRVVELGLQDRVLARVHTFGKGLGVHGAAVVGSTVLRDYLINFARSFIYTTALPPHSLLAIREAHQLVQRDANARLRLTDRLHYFQTQVVAKLPNTRWTDSQSPIQCLLVSGNDDARRVAAAGQQTGLDLRAILSPTVPIGQERIRICLHAFNTTDELDRLRLVLQTALHK
ncbi:aminotransferase class I/II-fold pyridoxal phosphate-dependent enzyme [Spirosoma rhododendri]|uniref:8-amino-7-oxononanoate synthase n=1 Tax=Spirosoma rhododendri TaxID=2728024 RepID=A0A7L5DJB2_9BACT|nr:8-amino-7-oxononanoate synthase [Spirosoma rhododendri]QJD78486.1 8-amino-7-oxononanoate synthase [Spirosoma rhododendri]